MLLPLLGPGGYLRHGGHSISLQLPLSLTMPYCPSPSPYRFIFYPQISGIPIWVLVQLSHFHDILSLHVMLINSPPAADNSLTHLLQKKCTLLGASPHFAQTRSTLPSASTPIHDGVTINTTAGRIQHNHVLCMCFLLYLPRGGIMWCAS